MKKFTFDVKKTVSYWVEGGEYDLGVATAMLKAKKYPKEIKEVFKWIKTRL